MQTKATFLAVAIGVLPQAAIGATAYYVANQSIVQEVSTAKKARAVGMADKANRFIFERYGDIQVLANLPILRNPKVKAVTTLQEKEAVLTRFAAIHGSYDSIAAFDLNGNVLVQSKGKTLPNHFNRAYFQEVLKTKKPVISDPEISKSLGKEVVRMAVQGFDKKYRLKAEYLSPCYTTNIKHILKVKN